MAKRTARRESAIPPTISDVAPVNPGVWMYCRVPHYGRTPISDADLLARATGVGERSIQQALGQELRRRGLMPTLDEARGVTREKPLPETEPHAKGWAARITLFFADDAKELALEPGMRTINQWFPDLASKPKSFRDAVANILHGNYRRTLDALSDAQFARLLASYAQELGPFERSETGMVSVTALEKKYPLVVERLRARDEASVKRIMSAAGIAYLRPSAYDFTSASDVVEKIRQLCEQHAQHLHSMSDLIFAYPGIYTHINRADRRGDNWSRTVKDALGWHRLFDRRGVGGYRSTAEVIVANLLHEAGIQRLIPGARVLQGRGSPRARSDIEFGFGGRVYAVEVWMVAEDEDEYDSHRKYLANRRHKVDVIYGHPRCNKTLVTIEGKLWRTQTGEDFCRYVLDCIGSALNTKLALDSATVQDILAQPFGAPAPACMTRELRRYLRAKKCKEDEVASVILDYLKSHKKAGSRWDSAMRRLLIAISRPRDGRYEWRVEGYGDKRWVGKGGKVRRNTVPTSFRDAEYGGNPFASLYAALRQRDLRDAES